MGAGPAVLLVGWALSWQIFWWSDQSGQIHQRFEIRTQWGLSWYPCDGGEEWPTAFGSHEGDPAGEGEGYSVCGSGMSS